MTEITAGIRITADGSGLVGEMRKGRDELGRFTRGVATTQSRLSGLRQVWDASVGGVRRLKNEIFSLRGALAGLGLGLTARSFLDAASGSEQYRIRLTRLLGSVEEGNRLFEEMNRFAARTPFEFEEIMGAATQLAGVVSGGVAEVSRWMPIIGDLAAVSGLSIQETTDQVVRMLSAGAASADLFRERGILAMLGFQAGVSYSAEETERQLVAAWEGAGSKFRGTTEDLSMSWNGILSMMSDKWFAFRNLVMSEGGLFDYIKSLGTAIDNELGRGLDGATGKARAFSETAIAGIEGMLKGLGYVLDWFNGISVALKGAEALFFTFATAVSAVYWGLGTVLQAALNAQVDAFNSFIDFVNEQVRKLPGMSDFQIGRAERFNFINPDDKHNFERDVDLMKAKWAEFEAALREPVPSRVLDRLLVDTQRIFNQIAARQRSGQRGPDDGLRGGGLGGAGGSTALDPIYIDMEVRTKTALDNVLEAFQNTHQQMNAAQASWAGGFTNTLTQALTTGAAAFDDFARQVIADLVRIWVQANITAPLFNGLFGGGATSGAVPPDDGFRPVPSRVAPSSLRASAQGAQSGNSGASVTIYQTIDARGADPASAAQLRQVAGRIKAETEASVLAKLSGSKRVARAVRTF